MRDALHCWMCHVNQKSDVSIRYSHNSRAFLRATPPWVTVFLPATTSPQGFLKSFQFPHWTRPPLVTKRSQMVLLPLLFWHNKQVLASRVDRSAKRASSSESILQPNVSWTAPKIKLGSGARKRERIVLRSVLWTTPRAVHHNWYNHWSSSEHFKHFNVLDRKSLCRLKKCTGVIYLSALFISALPLGQCFWGFDTCGK